MVKRDAGGKGERKQTAAVFICPSPDVLSEALIAIEASLGDGGIGENGRDQRREPHGGTELCHRILFIAVVDVGLNGGRLLHHSVAHRPRPLHVGRHNPVAFFRHPLNLLHGTDGLNPQAKKDHVQPLRHLHHLAHVLGELSAGAVDALTGLAAKLDLSSGLQMDLGVSPDQADDVALFLLRLPVVLLAQRLENGLHSSRTRVRNGLSATALDPHLFILRPHAPLPTWLPGAMKKFL